MSGGSSNSVRTELARAAEGAWDLPGRHEQEEGSGAVDANYDARGIRASCDDVSDSLGKRPATEAIFVA